MENETQADQGFKFSENELVKYGGQFKESNFWTKLAKAAKRLGSTLVEKVLTLYYSLRDDNTPVWAKTVIYGALGYFLMPFDLLPDFIPAVGFTDDMGAIISALSIVAFYVTDEHKKMAKEQMEKWFSMPRYTKVD